MEKENDSNENGGFVYILTNGAMPGYVKIGKTRTSVEQRIKELSRSTAVPFPFECPYAARVADFSKVEAVLHDAFKDHRENPKREFFKIEPERVRSILSYLALEDVTPSRDVGVETKEDAVAIESARKNRSAFNFKMVNISEGSVLNFYRDKKITCQVASDQKHVIFEGKEMSLSSAAKQALGSKYLVQGPAYWMYKDKILDEIRINLESGADNELTV